MDKATLDAIGEFLNEELVKLEKKLTAEVRNTDRATELLRRVEGLRIRASAADLRKFCRSLRADRSRLVTSLRADPGMHVKGLDQ